MNVKRYIDRNDENHDHESCRELANLIENMLRPIDPKTLTENFTLHIVATKFSGPQAILFHNSRRLAQFDIKAETLEMRVSYISNTKMSRLRTNFVYIPLAAPGSIERIQDMVRKAIKVLAKWSSKPFVPESETKPKNKKFRIAYRRR